MARAKAKTTGRSAPVRIELPPSVDASAIEPLADDIRRARGQAMELGGSAVRRLGGQGAQLLLVAAAAWRADGARLSLAEPSDELLEGLRLLGLGPDALISGDA